MPRRPQHPVVDRGPDFGTSSRSRTLEPPSRHRRSQRRFPFPIAAARTTSPPSTCPGTARNRKFLQQNPGRVADLCPPRSHMPRPHPPTARPAPAARLARRPLPLPPPAPDPPAKMHFPCNRPNRRANDRTTDLHRSHPTVSTSRAPAARGRSVKVVLDIPTPTGITLPCATRANRQTYGLRLGAVGNSLSITVPYSPQQSRHGAFQRR